MVKARKYVVKRTFDGAPKREDYEVVEYELPALKNGEFLVKAEWLSIDPSHRSVNSMRATPYDQDGFQLGQVIQSKHSDYPVGSRMVSNIGWKDYSIIGPTKDKGRFNEFIYYKSPDLKGLSPSLAIGAIGMHGATAYLGFLKVCEPKPGETVVVTGAAGAVGSLVGQIAKLKGCRVIGFAGSDDKVKWLEEELGFDRAFNYKTVDVAKALKEAAPDGIECYFDNVGGEISSKIMYQMNYLGRVTVCGSISSYNIASVFTPDPTPAQPKASIVQPAVLAKALTVKGFLIFEWDMKHWYEAFEHLTEWIKSGQVKAREHVTEGFDNVFDAFVDMLAGKNIGKALVKV